MRGLLFTGGKQPDMAIAHTLFNPYSFVVAADSGLCGAEKAGIVPDSIVGDMDSIPDASILDKYPSEKIQFWPRDKDLTDTEIALNLMKKKNIDEIILVGGSGGRLDHFFALKDLFGDENPPLMWITEESIALSVEKGQGRPAGSGITISGLGSDDPVSVFPAGSSPHVCRGQGFHWAIDSLDWDKGRSSLSNRSDNGIISFEAFSGRFLLVVPLMAGLQIERF